MQKHLVLCLSLLSNFQYRTVIFQSKCSTIVHFKFSLIFYISRIIITNGLRAFYNSTFTYYLLFVLQALLAEGVLVKKR